MVVGHESVELQGVELEAGVMDIWHILHGVFVHGQQSGGLEQTEKHFNNNTTDMTVVKPENQLPSTCAVPLPVLFD